MDSAQEHLSFSEKQLFKLFAEVDMSKKKIGSFEDYHKKVRDSVGQEKYPEYSKEDLNSVIKRYKYRKSKKLTTSHIIENSSSDIVLTVDFLEDNVFEDAAADVDHGGDNAPPPPVKKTRGSEEFNVEFSRSYNKEFSDLSEKWKRKITEPLI